MIKERPMLFSGPMVRGILEDRKTKTRRAIKNQPVIDPQTGDWLWTHSDGREQVFPMERYVTSRVINCKYGKVGDRLWVKETWKNKSHSFPTGMPFERPCKISNRGRFRPAQIGKCDARGYKKPT
jgi:hypothetical protein